MKKIIIFQVKMTRQHVINTEKILLIFLVIILILTLKYLKNVMMLVGLAKNRLMLMRMILSVTHAMVIIFH